MVPAMGRPKEFDRDQVLDRAMDVFWDLGYEATSIGDLVERLGIGRQSLYDTFGDKHALYLAALDRYSERNAGAAMLVASVPVRRGVRDFLQCAIEKALDGSGRTCMMVDAVAERCPGDEDVRQRFCANVRAIEDALTARLEQARESGEIARHHVARSLARYFVNAIQGLQLMGKGMRDRRELEDIADTTISILG
jgi:TetR/AcrR family transcriptional regulator, transcriptional repressor for nem operon